MKQPNATHLVGCSSNGSHRAAPITGAACAAADAPSPSDAQLLLLLLLLLLQSPALYPRVNMHSNHSTTDSLARL
jgi:hypothetical protein